MSTEETSINAAVSAYWDKRSQGYALQVDAQEENCDFQAYRVHLQGLSVGAKVLDVGCGPGFFATELAKEGACVTAVDMSQGMLEQTERRAKAKGVTIELALTDAQALPFADATFDLVCCRDLVWNLPDPKRAYQEWLRVLKPAGKLVIFDGNYYRYLFDERYARVHEAWEKTSGHVLLGVKTDEIDAIAETLPLGKVDRPTWDEKTLKSLGVQNVCTQTLSTYEDASLKQALIAKFVVIAQKNPVIL